MKSIASRAEQRVVLDPVSWSTYVALLADVANRRGRMAYDQGLLEIMSPSIQHENAKGFLARLLEASSEELEIELVSAGSLTMQRAGLQRGIEPDECYYVAHAPAVRGKEEIDLEMDPPPDIARVCEPDGSYRTSQGSAVLPRLPVGELGGFLNRRQAEGETRHPGPHRSFPGARPRGSQDDAAGGRRAPRPPRLPRQRPGARAPRRGGAPAGGGPRHPAGAAPGGRETPARQRRAGFSGPGGDG